MRISIVTGPWLPVPALEGGAMQRAWHGLADRFALRGHQVTVLAKSFAGQPARETVNGVHYLRSGGFTQSTSIALDLAKDFCYATRLLASLPQSDILVINDFWLPALAPLFRPRAGRVVISANRFPKRQYGLYRRAAMVCAASRAIHSAIIAQTPVMADRTRVVPNPVDTNVFYPGSDPKKQSKPDQPLLLYVGRLHPEKGVHILIDAFRSISHKWPRARLRLVGPAAAHQGGGGVEYEQLLGKLASGLSVEFAGPQFDTNVLAQHYRDADLFCYPSLAEKGESFGLAPLEAMACGTPPLVSSLACFTDFIKEGNTGWSFDHRQNAVANLANRLQDPLANPAELADAGRRAAVEALSFGYDAVADRFLAEFKCLVRN